MREPRSIFLIIGGGIAAYKSLELIRRLRERGIRVRCALTAAGREFVTPLSVASLSGAPVAEDLFDPAAEAEFGHIRLSRAAELVVVAPATADLIARMAAGLGSDLASTLLLATDAPVLAAPAMNVRMWEHPATQRNIETLQKDGVEIVGPDEGEMACGEYGAGRMAEPGTVLAAILARLELPEAAPLAGRRALVTAGPTHEPIDPVRFIGNRSSGKQGRAIAAELTQAGARTCLVAGPGAADALTGVEVVPVQTAEEMRDAVLGALPADLFVSVAAVADWRPAAAAKGKIRKRPGRAPPTLELVANPDILAEVSSLPATRRPALVVGFAAETGDVREAATAKRAAKGCDWILANDVLAGGGVFGSDTNEILLVEEKESEQWNRMSKYEVAKRLVARIGSTLPNPQ